MTNFYIIIGVIVTIGLLVKLFTNDSSGKVSKKTPYKYTKQNFLISRPEHEFFNILVELFSDQYHIFTQVHLPTIIDHKVPGQDWKPAFSHINGKSVDFVICDKTYIKPLLAIELDDKSHERQDRIERDSEVERMLQEAGMPLIRFENHGNFNTEEIRNRILEKLK